MFTRSLFLAIVLSCAYAGDVSSTTIKRALDPVTEAIENVTQAITESLETIVAPVNLDAITPEAPVLPDLGLTVNTSNVNIPGVSDALLNITNTIKAASSLLNSSMPALPNIPLPPIFEVADTKVAETAKVTPSPTPSPTHSATPSPTPPPSAAATKAEDVVKPTLPENPVVGPIVKEAGPIETPESTPFIQEDPKEVVHEYFDFWPIVWAAALSTGLLVLACLICCVCRDYRRHRAPALDSARGREGSINTQYLDI